MAAAVADGVAHPRSGVNYKDHIHLNDTGRLFTAQLMLNWLRLFARPHGGNASRTRMRAKPRLGT